MSQQWQPSDKGFQDALDEAIESWNNEATEEQKLRVAGKKRKNVSNVTASGEARSKVVQTPPTAHLMVVARAGLQTGTSTLSSLSSRSASTSLEQRPAPLSVTDDATASDDDRSVGTSARSSEQLENESDDGGDLDKEDDACEFSCDMDEDDKEFRPETEVEDLLARARCPVGKCLKALQ